VKNFGAHALHNVFAWFFLPEWHCFYLVRSALIVRQSCVLKWCVQSKNEEINDAKALVVRINENWHGGCKRIYK
jgi:hypothetical protein